MKLIKPTVEILDSIDEKEVISKIAKVARTCYKSEDLSTNDKDKQLVTNLIKSKHDAMLEFFDITVKFTTDRGVSHELVRHRVASYAQESTRYCNYSKDKFGNELTFIIPSWVEDPYKEDAWIMAMKYAENHYFRLINNGWTAQQARMVLPMSIKTEINMKANLREWRHFFELRCSKAAHPDMRYLALNLLKQMYIKLPTIFSDIYERYKEDTEENE